jgi:hypothetical protein
LNVRFCNRRTGAAILTAALAVLFPAPAAAGPIQLGVFQEFAFSTAGTPATGCDPADPAGPFCIPSGGTPTSFLTAPPWIFVAPLQGAVLIVTDAFDAGDRFQIFDFGISLGLTSVPVGNGIAGMTRSSASPPRASARAASISRPAITRSPSFPPSLPVAAVRDTCAPTRSQSPSPGCCSFPA